MLNRVIAMNGAKTFFEMLLQHNFVHADCHAGNILVRIVEDDNLWQRKWRNISQDIHNIAMYILIHFGFDSPVLKRLSR